MSILKFDLSLNDTLLVTKPSIVQHKDLLTYLYIV